jgi:hypothetical protein
MAKRRLWTAGLFVALLLAFPRDGHAGLWEFIIEMSGPQMFGGASGCSLDFDDTRLRHCSLLGFPLRTDNGKLTLGWLQENPPRVWLLLQSGAYISTGKDAEDSNFRFGRVGMLTADPMIAFRSDAGKHAIGVSYNFIFAESFKPVHNLAVKASPLIWRMLKLDWDVTLRFYKNGFDVVESSNPAILMKGDEFELVVGISASVPMFN